MGVSIYWRPIANGHNVTPGARSAFYDALTVTFGSMPITLTGNDISMLNAMQVAATDPETKKSYKELAEAVEKHEEIEIYAAW